MADLLTEVTSGRLTGLRAIRDGLAVQLADCDSKRDYATLAARLVEVLAQIEAVEKAQPERKGTAVDEFTRRRAEREAASPSGSAPRQQRR